MPKKKTTKKAAKRAAKKVAKKASHARALGKTQISISLPEDLVEKIDRLAVKENRNRSNYIATALEEIAGD